MQIHVILHPAVLTVTVVLLMNMQCVHANKVILELRQAVVQNV